MSEISLTSEIEKLGYEIELLSGAIEGRKNRQALRTSHITGLGLK